MDIKYEIIDKLKSTNRTGIRDLICHMENICFFSAPCSSQYHLCKVGGLAEHSLNVYQTMTRFYNAQSEYTTSDSEIIITSLLHDLGKASYREQPNYIPNELKGGKVSTAKPFVTNPDRLYIPHEVVSLQIASKYIELTAEEEFAILYHNGLYVSSGRDLQGKERPLQMLLHFADLWCSRVVEKEDEKE